MASDRPTLSSPLPIRGQVLHNRLGLAPMSRLSSSDGVPRPDTLELLIRRARAGVALIYTEAVLIDDQTAPGYPGQSWLTSRHHVAAWRPAVQAIHDAGARMIMQINHCGRLSQPALNRAGRVIAPSPLAALGHDRTTEEPYPVPDEMSQGDIEAVVAGFCATARKAAEIGCAGVEIHAAHGYLIHQFLSPVANRRTDAYGGDAFRRVRLLSRIVDEVRSVLPTDRLLTVRLSDHSAIAGEDLFPRADDYLAVVYQMAQRDVDAISVSAADFHSAALGTGLSLAHLTRSVWPGPIFVGGGIHDAATAQAALQAGDVALVGKSLLLNPYWVEHMRSGWPLARFGRGHAGIAYGACELM